MSDDGVAPVISTMLMVAVVVVVSATTFMMFNISRDNEPPPEAIGLARDENKDTLRVARANPSYSWENYQIRSVEDVAGLHYSQNLMAKSSDPALSNEYRPLEGTSIVAGQFISLCADTPLGEVTVQIRDVAANAVIYEATFRSIGICT